MKTKLFKVVAVVMAVMVLVGTMVFTAGAAEVIEMSTEGGVLAMVFADRKIKTPTREYMYGDADSDWCVSIMDTSRIQKFLVDATKTMDTVAADIDDDGEITICDATGIQRWLVNEKFFNDYKIGDYFVSDLDADGNALVSDSESVADAEPVHVEFAEGDTMQGEGVDVTEPTVAESHPTVGDIVEDADGVEVTSDSEAEPKLEILTMDAKKPLASYNGTSVTANNVSNDSIPRITGFDSKDEGVKISYSKVSGVNRYAVYYKNRNGNWVRMGTSTNGVFIDTDVSSGSRYLYTVRGLSDDAKSFRTDFYRDGWYYTYNMESPEVTDISSVKDGVKIYWKEVPNAERYRVYYRGSKGWTCMGSTTGTSFVDTDVRYGSTYTYTVRCVNYKNNRFTSSFNGSGWKHTHYLNTPVGFDYDCYNGGINLTWSKVDGAAKYRVFYYGSRGWTRMADVTGTSYTDWDVREGGSYTYVVRCISADGSRYTSDFKSGGWRATLLNTPSGVSIKSTEDGNEITWKPVSGANAYRVFYKNGDSWKGITNVTDTKFVDTDVEYDKSKTYTVRCVTPSGMYWRSGYNTSGWSKVYDYTAPLTPKPTDVDLADIGENETEVPTVVATEAVTEAPTVAPTVAPTEAPTEKPTEVVVDAPSEVKVVEGSSGKKVYEKVAKYQLKSNLHSTSLTVDLSNRESFFWKSAVEDELWINSHIEYLSDGKVRLYFAPNAYEKITSLKGALLGESGKWYVFDIPVSTIKNGSGYYDYQMPEVESQSSNPSIKVSWGESSNADSYEVRALDAKGNAVSSVVRTGSTSATVTLNTADAGTYSVEVKAVKGNKSATAKGTFSLNTEFITETEGSTIKVPVIFRNTRFVCNKCGREVGAKVKDHISPIDSTELREKYADSLYTYKYKPTAGRDNAWVAAWAGTPDVTLTAGYFDLGDYYYHPLSSSDPDYTINYVADDSLERPASMATKFSLAEFEEKINNCGNQTYINLGTDFWLNDTMSTFHRDIEGCSSAYHSEDCISISGLQEIVIPATGYTKVSVG